MRQRESCFSLEVAREEISTLAAATDIMREEKEQMMGDHQSERGSLSKNLEQSEFTRKKQAEELEIIKAEWERERAMHEQHMHAKKVSHRKKHKVSIGCSSWNFATNDATRESCPSKRYERVA